MTQAAAQDAWMAHYKREHMATAYAPGAPVICRSGDPGTAPDE